MRLLDLYCGAGGAAKGYEAAGFDEIKGVDNKPQKHYPYEFVQADALEYLEAHGREFDAIHASPPCQGYSLMTLNLPWFKGREYPLLILPTMELLERSGRPYVLENVMGARHGSVAIKKRGLEEHGLQAGWLCGTMFGLPFYRHRLFAANWLWLAPPHEKHHGRVTTGSGPGQRGRDISEQIVAHPNPVDSAWRQYHDGTKPTTFTDLSGRTRTTDNKLSLPNENGGLNLREGYETKQLSYPTIQGGLSRWQANGAAPGIGHTAGWKLAAEAMGIDWMNRDELTQAIPPVMTEHIGRQMLALLKGAD